MAFSFTSDPIGDAVRARAEEGVTVAGVMDAEQVDSNIGTEFDAFSQAGWMYIETVMQVRCTTKL
jgi:hypothetical protein